MDLSTLWGQGSEQPLTPVPGDFTPVATGTYNVTLHAAAVELSGPTAKVALQYKIQDEGEFLHRVLFSNYQLTANGTHFLKRDLAKLGYTDQPKNLDDLSKVLQTLVGKRLEVKAIQRNYTKANGQEGVAHNVYVNHLLDAATVSASEPKFDSKEPLPF
jgi:hypothetical protein